MEKKSSVNFGRCGGPIHCRVDDLCNHVGFTDVAAQTSCWRHFVEKKSLDLRLREGAVHSVAPLSQPHLKEKRAETGLLYYGTRLTKEEG
jgi:hypothetical protein